MSMPLVALCADEECFRHPELLGLEGENLLAQQWLMPFTSAEQARAKPRPVARMIGKGGGRVGHRQGNNRLVGTTQRS